MIFLFFFTWFIFDGTIKAIRLSGRVCYFAVCLDQIWTGEQPDGGMFTYWSGCDELIPGCLVEFLFETIFVNDLVLCFSFIFPLKARDTIIVDGKSHTRHRCKVYLLPD